jgi:branched-chain amino acid transport system ATP-binding protein
MLAVTDLNAWYGRSHVLQGIDLTVRRGEIVSLIGRNGAGKTTTLRTIMGLITRRSGRVEFEGVDILSLPVHHRHRLGIGFVPEDRRIVAGLSVRENLRLGMLADVGRRHAAAFMASLGDLFPRLVERLDQPAETLSGGEQQMLAIARAFAAAPKLMILDEPSEGIMPVLVNDMFELFGRMRRDGVTVLLVEQNVERALSISDRAYIIDQGMIVHQGDALELLANTAIQERYCAV